MFYKIWLVILSWLSRKGIYSQKRLYNVLLKEATDLRETPFELHHHPDLVGIVYIEAKGDGALSGLVICVDYRANGNFENPVTKIEQYPERMREAYLHAKENMDDPEWGNFMQALVYGFVPMIMEQCRNHITSEFQKMMETKGL